MVSEKQRVEAVLFASGKKVPEQDIAKLTQLSEDVVRKFLREIQLDYDARETALQIFEDNDGWKMSVKEKFSPFIRNIVAETELSKSVMETLGVIAWKYPAPQSDIIKIRTNKAYDHLDQLEEMGFITREKWGRSKRIRLTEKFFNYFDLPKNKEAFKKIIPEEIKEKVEKAEKDIDSHEKVIEEDQIKKELAKQKQKQIEKFGQKPEPDAEDTEASSDDASEDVENDDNSEDTNEESDESSDEPLTEPETEETQDEEHSEHTKKHSHAEMEVKEVDELIK